MKKLFLLTVFLVQFLVGKSQDFVTEFLKFKESTVDLEYDALNSMYPRPYESYYKGYNLTPSFENVLYLDSITQKLNLTSDELALLQQNHFFVSERLSFQNFGVAYHDAYYKDLPVFVSSDLILHALHTSYSLLLKTFERLKMSNNIELVLEELYNALPGVNTKYGTDFYSNVQDVDLFITTAYSLIVDEKKEFRYENAEVADNIWTSIANLNSSDVPLFTIGDRTRKIDFSQFKVRGHYVYTEEDEMMGSKNLEPYFRTLMWLGRIDFFLSPPPANPWEPKWTFEEIKHMNMSAFILNEMIQNCAHLNLFEENEKIINYFVGISDNITINEYQSVLDKYNITSASALYDSITYDKYYNELISNEAFAQKIMGGIFFVDPDSSVPGVLPVSYRVAGQRFIIDSEVLSNVVFDRIIFENKKMKRLMPDPLDAMYCLGNSDAFALLKNEVETYKYGRNLANMRYLIDTESTSFWNESLYNAWLNSIRQLNPEEYSEDAPFFMKTGAWHQQKLNTQLASYTQLRHDNLLYAKPSYTGGTGCSFPYGYVEPYPEFYRALSTFANNVGTFLNTIDANSWEIMMAKEYFPKFGEIMEKLALLAEKELKNEAFNEEDAYWLKQFLFESTMSGEPPYSGWISSLFLEPFDIIKDDYIVVDLHTQPTDSMNVEVGKVLHTATGKINQGVFLIDQPGTSTPTAYVGAFMSYYKKITSNYMRLTDQDWAQLLEANELPSRPEWVHSYLANANGNTSVAEIELPTTMLIENESVLLHDQNNLIQIYPNPVVDEFQLKVEPKIENANIRLIDATGKVVLNAKRSSGESKINAINLQAGIYVLEIESNGKRRYQKIVKE